MDIDALAVEIAKINEEKGFTEEWNLPEKLCLIHSEISEALEELRTYVDPAYSYLTGDKPCGFTVELADTIIRILHIFAYYNINPSNVIQAKLDYNKTRPYKHGRKF